ncbi:MAG: pentapeptide repeat-containing protein [gamma proteobacterium symbiont of Bathyaustriella thionipta]|nr:pentapeptide repeat-containing protein [gamma proteobacterium symbiont of Bathyaustriella thionipta]MCU7949112.1 pentapeptide repeat-containing protein [gamma proteobacterium symbiont of Bathyaustriella thionipta]MCU7954423.1 pentapeptide repeat-containing protein [gamma proteobacterium symbiont of Bathyaustriella thionipta]MCU7955715.1 pentapeptide repeat-containing protein [gamma proteobacterium symbiont of Bathyaustriella thionipta]MCU7966191.1 pentapeptide repeat-containing protein [gamm
MNKETQLWYLKVKGRVKGPYASGLISKNILLGRIHPSDLLSQDKEIWRKASAIREVMPDVIKYRNEPNYKERLRAARRWADERESIREVDDNGQEIHYEPRKKVTHLRIKTTGIIGLISIIAIISGLIFAMFKFTPDDPLAKINCSAQAQDGMLFYGCHLQRKIFNKKSIKNSSFKNALLQNTQFRQSSLQHSNFDYANLSHADLSQTNFTGASLRASDLRGATLTATIFTKADLSYADLTGAKASKIKLTRTILGGTIWFDGQVCHKESIGRCQQ